MLLASFPVQRLLIFVCVGSAEIPKGVEAAAISKRHPHCVSLGLHVVAGESRTPC